MDLAYGELGALLAAVLEPVFESKRPEPGGRGCPRKRMCDGLVAGAGFEPATFRL
jgi:hypothetical protein